MALKKKLVTPQGFVVEDAYFRVESLALLDKTGIVFSVRSYKDVGNASISEQGFGCPYDLTGDNPIAQAYEHLKTLPEFSDATDC